jgi:hypothetical protein
VRSSEATDRGWRGFGLRLREVKGEVEGKERSSLATNRGWLRMGTKRLSNP